jgi:hypothetical protein
MVLVVTPHAAGGIQRQLADLGFENWQLGTVHTATADQDRVVLR